MDKLSRRRGHTPRQPFITDETGRDLIPLTAAEARRLFNLHTRVTRPAAFHEHWSDWRRYRQASARKSHYARRTRSHRRCCSTRAKQLLLQHDELTAEAKQLTIDSKAQLAQLKDLSNSLSDQRWALEVLGSDEVRRLANVVLGEILEAVDVLNKTGKSQEFDYDNWGRLNKAMREELQILD